MDRTYSGSLGLIAMLTVLTRGWVQGGVAVEVVLHAWMALWCFAALGFVMGRLAQSMIDESVRARLAQELASRETDTQPRHKPPLPDRR